MALAAAHEVARFAQERGIHEEYIVPRMDEFELYPREAAATAMKAQEQGVAKLSKTWDQLHEQAAKTIQEARTATRLLMREGCIPQTP